MSASLEVRPDPHGRGEGQCGVVETGKYASASTAPSSSVGHSGGAFYEERQFIVSRDIIVDKLAPLYRKSLPELCELVDRYDVERKGGLTAQQWTRFCDENPNIITVGEQMLDFDRCGEYTIVTVERTTGDENKVSQNVSQKVVSFLESFAAGGLAGAVSKTVIAPADRVKIIFQVERNRHFSVREAFRLGAETVREFGVTGLWIGNGATMMRVVPYAAITYVSFEHYRVFFRSILAKADGTLDEGSAVTVRFVSGALAGATSTTCTYPLDLMRARLAAHSSSRQSRIPTYYAAFEEAVAANGIRSLYAGLFPTLVGIMPYAGCSFMCFETIKTYIVRWRGLENQKDITAWERLVAGAFSGLVAQSATYPLDIVRRRMQVSPGRYSGVVNVIATVFREEGIRQGIYKGLVMNWIKGPIATATSFTVNDLIKRRTRNYHSTPSPIPSRRDAVTVPETLVCGGVAACGAKLWTLPFDKLKIMYQLGITDMDKTSVKGVRQLASLVCRFPNMWSSGQVVMARAVPFGALFFLLIDLFMPTVERLMLTHEATPLTNFVAGATAPAVCTFLFYPLDLLRTHMAANVVPSFRSYFWLFRHITRRSGVKSLWQGCQVAMMNGAAVGGIAFTSYECLKDYFSCDTFGERLMVGTLAGIVGQAVTYPLNVAKRRRQMQNQVFSSTPKVDNTLLRNPRLYAAMYRKLPLVWSVGSVSLGLFFSLNDLCRDICIGARKDMLRELVLPGGKD